MREPDPIPSGALDAVYRRLTGKAAGEAREDVPDEAARRQPANFLTHVGSLAATKTADGLADPKLTLAWLVTALGAPPVIVGLLVPVREAGSLLPQLIVAPLVRTLARRKLAWAVGTLVQGLAALGMALSVLYLPGTEAGWSILALLAVFALARGVSSVSYKDVLGKTVAKSTRGTATGSAATVAALAVLGFGTLLALGVIPLTITSIAAVLCVAAGLRIAAAGLFATLAEAPGPTERTPRPLRSALAQFRLLREDPQLVRFIAVRGLLVSTALAPPYLLHLSATVERKGLGELGPFVMASALAAIGSTYLWGRLADRSSRGVLIRSGVIGGAVLAVSGAVGLTDVNPGALRWLLPVLLFVLMVAYQGVRLGRSTYLVDMASEDKRLAYTALANTVIGALLVLASGFAALAEAGGYPLVLLVFAAMALAAAWLARGLEDVSAG